jgi:hypothetical protein
VSLSWEVITDSAKRAQPLARARSSRTEHDERVRPTGDEYIEDFREVEELTAYFIHHVAAV